MLTPAGGRRVGLLNRGQVWAADNGCSAHPERFDLSRYLDWLVSLAEHRVTCLFATAPDVPGDWAATWRRSEPVLPRLREHGYRAAIVVQDGCTQLPPAEDWDVLFVGGTTRWKLTAGYDLVAAAKRLGKWTHMGRCNSFARLRQAHAGGYDSADGTCLRFNPPQYVGEIARWLDWIHQQPALAEGVA